MKNLLARGGIEFLAVLLGISGSLWIDENQENRKQKEYQGTILESIYNDIIQTEKFFIESRDPAFRADSIWMDYFAYNWENMNVDSVAIAMSKEESMVFHTLFFDFREFHPPLSSIEMIMQDGSLKDINNIEIRKTINKLFKTDLGFVLKNVQGEIDMQINFRNTLVNQNDPKLARIFSISQNEIKNRIDDNVENYRRPIEELKYFLTKDYARTYINLKNRNRYNVTDYIRSFKKTLQELKILVDQELGIS
tara:strand:- start:2530 stop:3282 length:753 start_codon:yes stop_codon:yes gene_type:complete